MPEKYLDMIPRMAARTWTGAPAEVFYNMYEDGEDFTSSMTQHIQSRFGEYDDPLEFDDMELYNIDEFAVEKAAYQQQFDFPVAGTPWGDPLTPEELDQVSIDYPGVIPGFDINSDEEILKEVYDLSDSAEFNKAAAKIDERIETEGLIGNEPEIYSNFGDSLANEQQTGNLGRYNPMNVSPYLGYEAIKGIGEELPGAWDNIKNWGSNVWDALVDTEMQKIESQQAARAGALDIISGINVGAEIGPSGTFIPKFDYEQDTSRMDKFNEDMAVIQLNEIESTESPVQMAQYLADGNNYKPNIDGLVELDENIVNIWLENFKANNPDDPRGIMYTDAVASGARDAAEEPIISDIDFATFGEQGQRLPTTRVRPTYDGDYSPAVEDDDLFQFLNEQAVEQAKDNIFTDDLPGADPIGVPLDSRGSDYDEFMERYEEDKQKQGFLDFETETQKAQAALDAERGVDPTGLSQRDLEDAPLSFQDRFGREFNRRPGTSGFEMQRRRGALFDEAEMLYYLTEADNPRNIGYMELSENEYGELKEKYKREPEDELKELDYFSDFTNRFFDEPYDIRNNLFSAAESLRDNMSKYAGLSYEEVINGIEAETIDPSTIFQRVAFMDPANPNTFDRTALLVSQYNVPEDSDPWFKNRMKNYYSRMLQNWELSGRSREDFLQTFISRPKTAETKELVISGDPTTTTDDEMYQNI